MTPEQREARAAEVEKEISREWLRFAITEAVLLWLPWTILVALYAVDAISLTSLVPAVVVAVVFATALVTYWVVRRINPRRKELEALRGCASLPA
jgi:hypothetical protein